MRFVLTMYFFETITRNCPQANMSQQLQRMESKLDSNASFYPLMATCANAT